MLATTRRRVAIALLVTLALLGGYNAFSQGVGTRAAPATTQWTWIAIKGASGQFYNGHYDFDEYLGGADGRNDQSDIFQCPGGPNAAQGCWQGGASTEYWDYSPYFYETYVVTQERCNGGAWYNDQAARQNQGYYPTTKYEYEAYTDWVDFANCNGHDEQIYAQHTFIMYSNGGLVSEHTCSQPPASTMDC